MENYFVYILLSEITHKFYIGQTNNIKERLRKHNSGYNKSTKSGIPWRLFAYCHCSSRAEAMKLERKVKNLKSRNRLIKYTSENKGWFIISNI